MKSNLPVLFSTINRRVFEYEQEFLFREVMIIDVIHRQCKINQVQLATLTAAWRRKNLFSIG